MLKKVLLNCSFLVAVFAYEDGNKAAFYGNKKENTHKVRKEITKSNITPYGASPFDFDSDEKDSEIKKIIRENQESNSKSINSIRTASTTF